MFGAHDQMSGVRLRTNRPGHLLVIPFRHVADFFDATDAELAVLLRDAKHLLGERFHPDGYNIGTAAGQTVMHLHVHVIPRYAGDVEDPRAECGGLSRRGGCIRGDLSAPRPPPYFRISLPSIIYQVKLLLADVTITVPQDIIQALRLPPDTVAAELQRERGHWRSTSGASSPPGRRRLLQG
jgi:hypothetical protein